MRLTYKQMSIKQSTYYMSVAEPNIEVRFTFWYFIQFLLNLENEIRKRKQQIGFFVCRNC